MNINKNSDFSSNMITGPLHPDYGSFLYKYPEDMEEPFICVKALISIHARYPYHYPVSPGPCFFLIYTVDGQGVLSCGQKHFELFPETLCFFSCSAGFRLKIGSPSWHYRVLVLSGAELPYFYSLYTAKNPPVIPVSKDSALLQLFNSIGKKGTYLLETPLDHIAFITKLLTYVITMKQYEETSQKAPAYLLEIKRKFDQTYQNYYTLDILEDEFHINKYKLAKDFTRFFGVSPISYLNNRRIEQAKVLLVTTNDRINEVGRKVGYENTNHFINSFKKQTGQTPMNFRKARIL